MNPGDKLMVNVDMAAISSINRDYFTKKYPIGTIVTVTGVDTINNYVDVFEDTHYKFPATAFVNLSNKFAGCDNKQITSAVEILDI